MQGANRLDRMATRHTFRVDESRSAYTSGVRGRKSTAQFPQRCERSHHPAQLFTPVGRSKAGDPTFEADHHKLSPVARQGKSLARPAGAGRLTTNAEIFTPGGGRPPPVGSRDIPWEAGATH